MPFPRRRGPTLWGTLMLAGPAAWELFAGTVVMPMRFPGSRWPTSACSEPRWPSSGTTRCRRGRAGQRHPVLNLVPVFAVILSVLLLGERPVPASLIGGLMVVCGVILAESPGAVISGDQPGAR